MSERSNTFRHLYVQSYSGSRWLTITGILMLVDIVLSLVGLVTDRSTVMGDPTWLKPLKFGISTALFSFTVAWMIAQLPSTRRFLIILSKIFAAIMSVALILEIVLIDMQAARHTSSHFNTALPFDQKVFATMGFGIAIVFASTVILFLITCFIPFQDRPLAWAIRLSLALALAGMSTGVLMTLPTPERKAQLRVGGSLPRSGGHTVGAPDGGPGIPLTGWSADHGDLRIAHFIGLHAMQLLLLAWSLTRTAQWSCTRKLALITGFANSIAAAYAVVLIQALNGQPFLRPDPQTIAAWVLWAAATGSLLLWARLQNHRTATLTSEAN